MTCLQKVVHLQMEGMFGPDTLSGADEVFITSTAGGVMPVAKVNGKQVGIGTPGKITTLIRKSYWEAHDEDRWTTPVDYKQSIYDKKYQIKRANLCRLNLFFFGSWVTAL